MEIIEKDLNDSCKQSLDRLRVKVFIYFADQWREKGIGFLGVTKIENDEKSYEIYEDYYKSVKSEEVTSDKNTDEKAELLPIYKLTVRSQQDTHERLISTYITNTVDYRVQEGSILTWKEGENEKALSFECAEDCDKFMTIVASIRQVIADFNSCDSTASPLASLKDADVLKTSTNATTAQLKQLDDEGVTESDWNLLLNSDEQTSGIVLNGEKDDDDDEDAAAATLNETSSIWHDEPATLTLPEICVDNLDEWIQLLSFSSLNVSNILGPETANMLMEKLDTPATIENANQLYRYMSTNDVLKQFVDLFIYYESEEHNALDVLFKLHDIFKGFISADNFDIFRLMFEESIPTLLDVVGILEYDSTMDTRTHHRDYLKNKAKFRKFFLLDDSVTNEFPMSPSKTNSVLSREVSIDVDDTATTPSNTKETEVADDNRQSTLEQICEKATLIYYIQYIIDHIMPTPSIFDDKLGPMTTYLNHHKADLCNLIYDNTVLLNNLFVFLTSDGDSSANDTKQHIATKDDVEEENRTIEAEHSDDNTTTNNGTIKPTLDDYIDSVLFLHEFCLLSNSLNPSDKEFFFHWLESYNLLQVLTRLLHQPNVKIRAKVVDIIALLVDNKATTIRAFNSSQIEKALGAETTTNMCENVCLMDGLIDTVVEYSDDPVSLHCINIINQLMDNDIMNNTDISYFEKMELFCAQFFTYSFTKFFKPFTRMVSINGDDSVADYPSQVDTGVNAMLLDRLLALLTRWIVYHHDFLAAIIVRERVVSYVTPLLKCSHKFVVCGVVRFVRKLVDLKDNFINQELNKCATLSKIADLFATDCCYNCNSLLNNTIVELFNFLLVEDIEVFYMPLVDQHRTLFNSIDYIDIFKRLVARHDANLNKCEGGGVSLSLCTTTNSSAPNNNLSELYNSVRKRKSCEFENAEERWFDSDDVDCRPNLTDSAASNSSDTAIDDALNFFLYGDTDVAHVSKKIKNSPDKDTHGDDLANSNISVDDETLFDLLVGSVRKSKNSSGSDTTSEGDETTLNKSDQEEDFIDALLASPQLLTPQLPKTQTKRQNIIKIHTNNFNSPRNLVIASTSPATSDEKSLVDSVDSSTELNNSACDADHKATSPLVINTNIDKSAMDSPNDNTLDYTNGLVETTFEDDSVMRDEESD